MEYMLMKKRQMVKKNILRLLVIAAVYAGLLAGAVAVSLGMVWIVKNTLYGWFILLAGCLMAGGWLFFRLSREGCVGSTMQYS